MNMNFQYFMPSLYEGSQAGYLLTQRGVSYVLLRVMDYVSLGTKFNKIRY